MSKSMWLHGSGEMDNEKLLLKVKILEIRFPSIVVNLFYSFPIQSSYHSSAQIAVNSCQSNRSKGGNFKYEARRIQQ